MKLVELNKNLGKNHEEFVKKCNELFNNKQAKFILIMNDNHAVTIKNNFNEYEYYLMLGTLEEAKHMVVHTDEYKID